jgi:tRNA (guanine-N7-)-methyltransferase
MPHIKVAPFEIKRLNKLKNLEFCGASDSGNELLLMIKSKEQRVFFDLIKREDEYLIKPNKIAKSANTELLKKSLNKIASKLDLEVLLSNTATKNIATKKRDKYLKSIEDFYNFKTDFKKVKLEVGFGSGRHLLYRAKNEPKTLFIGIEIHTPSINQTLRQIELNGLKNVIILNYDARLLLEMLPSNILDKIYVHFPVPWDKKPHRRVISKKFLKESIRVLKKGSSLELRTDSINYYQYSLEVFSKPKKATFKVEKNVDIKVRSKYEDRWRRMNKDIYTLTFKSLKKSKKRDLKFNFNFKVPKSELTLPKDSIVKDDFFVHFGKVYKSLSDSSMVVECAFGDFSMPEKKMLYISSKKCKYYPTAPVKSVANYKAHKFIKEVING